MCRTEVILYHYCGCQHNPVQYRGLQRCNRALWTNQPCDQITYTTRTKKNTLLCHVCRGVDIAQEEARFEPFLAPPTHFWWSGTCPLPQMNIADLEPGEIPQPNIHIQQTLTLNKNINKNLQTLTLSQEQIQQQVQNQIQNLQNLQPNGEQPMLQFHYNATWKHN